MGLRFDYPYIYRYAFFKRALRLYNGSSNIVFHLYTASECHDPCCNMRVSVNRPRLIAKPRKKAIILIVHNREQEAIILDRHDRSEQRKRI